MNKSQIITEYLGDGVYANVGQFEGEIILTTSCHLGAEGQYPDNTIYLDPQTAHSLHLYLKRIFETPTHEPL